VWKSLGCRSAHQVERLHPWGASRSWGLLIEKPERPSWPFRVAGGLVSLALGVATTVSDSMAGLVASLVAGTGQLLTVAVHVFGIVGPEGSLGVVGRLLAVAAVVAAVTRLAWRFTGWGVASIGDDR
jgi:hypothetical protein